jgi:pimeloyl-ACP methyl ester carboxylesterase
MVKMEPLLKDIRVPTLVLWGDTDRVLDVSAADVYARGLPDATLVVMKKCGHVPMLERPAETAEHYRAFLKAHPAPVK